MKKLFSGLVLALLITSVFAVEWEQKGSFKGFASEVNYIGFYDAKNGIAVGASGFVRYTNNGGKKWKKGKNTSRCLFTLDMLTKDFAWAAGDGNHVRFTKDGGKNWETVPDLFLNDKFSVLDFCDEKTGWIGTRKRLAMTTDGSQTFTQLTLPENYGDISAIYLFNEKTGYVVNTVGRMIKTKDAGATWEDMTIDFTRLGVVNEKNKPGLYKLQIPGSVLYFADENNGMFIFQGVVSGKGTHLFCMETKDGGNTWTDSEIPVPEGFQPNTVYLNEDATVLTVSNPNKDSYIFVRK